MRSDQVALVYNYLNSAVWRKYSESSSRLLPAGGSLGKIRKHGAIFYYSHFYDGGKQHSRYLGGESKLQAQIEAELKLLEMDNLCNEYLKSLRYMGLPMPCQKSQRIMRQFAREHYDQLGRVVRLDLGAVHSWAAKYGDFTLARKVAGLTGGDGFLEFGVKRGEEFETDLPVKFRIVPADIVDFADVESFVAVPGLPMLIPEKEFFLELHPEIRNDRKLWNLIEAV